MAVARAALAGHAVMTPWWPGWCLSHGHKAKPAAVDDSRPGAAGGPDGVAVVCVQRTVVPSTERPARLPTSRVQRLAVLWGC